MSAVDEDPLTAAPCLTSKARTKLGLYIDKETEELPRKPERTARNTHDSKSTSRGVRVKTVDAEPTSKTKLSGALKESSKVMVDPNPGSESTKASPKGTAEANTAVASSRTTTAAKVEHQSQKRLYGMIESEQPALPPPPRKRVKAVRDETLVGLTEGKDTGQRKVVRRAEKKKT